MKYLKGFRSGNLLWWVWSCTQKNGSLGKAHDQHWDTTTASHMANTKVEDPFVLHEYGKHSPNKIILRILWVKLYGLIFILLFTLIMVWFTL